MKRFLGLTAIVLCLLACEQGSPKDDQQVIRVNGTWLMKDDVEEVVQLLRTQMRGGEREQALFGGSANVRRRAAHELIANQLMLEQARARQILVSDSVVNASFEALKQRLGDEKFAQQMQMSGQTEEQVKQYVRDGMAVDSLLNIVAVPDSVTEQQCRDYYEKNGAQFKMPARVRASQILLRYDTTSVAEEKEKRALAKQLLKRAQSGADFAALAKAHSQGPNASRGGDIGWFGRGDLLREIEAAVFGMRVGEISGIVESPLGLLLIRKTDEQEAKTVEFEKVLGDIRKGLTLQSRARRLRSYTDSLIETASIEYRDSSYAPSSMK